jgi:hypothetical protein
MDQRTLFIIVSVAVLIAAALFAWWYTRGRQRKHLRQRFGPEYDRTVAGMKDQRRAEMELAKREKQVQKLHLRQLSAGDRQRFVSAWQAVQARFVDDPADAATQAERLLQDLMMSIGYPRAEYAEVAAYVSVNHPRSVQNFRDAHEIALRHRRGEAGTEQLRQAIVYYRALFDDLLQEQRAA